MKIRFYGLTTLLRKQDKETLLKWAVELEKFCQINKKYTSSSLFYVTKYGGEPFSKKGLIRHCKDLIHVFIDLDIDDGSKKWCADCKSKANELLSRYQNSIHELINEEYQSSNEEEKKLMYDYAIKEIEKHYFESFSEYAVRTYKLMMIKRIIGTIEYDIDIDIDNTDRQLNAFYESNIRDIHDKTKNCCERYKLIHDDVELFDDDFSFK